MNKSSSFALTALAALLASACSQLPVTRDTNPVTAMSLANVCNGALPSSGKIRSNLTLHQTYNDEHLFLAINAEGEHAPVIDLLTLQGMPIYRLECGPDGPSEHQFVQLLDKVPDAAIMAYIGLIYGGTKAALLAPGWESRIVDTSHFVVEPMTDEPTTDDASRKMEVETSGPGPWYTSARLRDHGTGISVTLHNAE